LLLTFWFALTYLPRNKCIDPLLSFFLFYFLNQFISIGHKRIYKTFFSCQPSQFLGIKGCSHAIPALFTSWLTSGVNVPHRQHPLGLEIVQYLFKTFVSLACVDVHYDSIPPLCWLPFYFSKTVLISPSHAEF